jgi:hypothetical protein
MFKWSPSALAEFYESPAHYESKYILKESEETDSMRLGTAMHMAILEPKKFQETYIEKIEAPQGTLVTGDDMKSACKEMGLKQSGTKSEMKERLQEKTTELACKPFVFYDEWLLQYAKGRELLTPKELTACNRIVKRIQDNSKLRFMVNDGQAELAAWWIHERTKTVVSMRMDYVKDFPQPLMINGIAYDGVIIDVKKVPKKKTKLRPFQQLLWDRYLFLAAALYVDGMEQITGKKYMFLWVAAEDSPPYPVQGFPADFGLLEAGRNEYNKSIDELIKCKEANDWPCYSVDFSTATLPKYAWEQLEVRDEESGS